MCVSIEIKLTKIKGKKIKPSDYIIGDNLPVDG